MVLKMGDDLDLLGAWHRRKLRAGLVIHLALFTKPGDREDPGAKVAVIIIGCRRDKAQRRHKALFFRPAGGCHKGTPTDPEVAAAVLQIGF